MNTIFVAGPWGSGTTALAGALHHLGVSSFGPFFQSYDPRTLNTFEWVPFRNVMLKHADEAAIARKSEAPELVSDLAAFRERVEAGAYGRWDAGRSRNLLLKMPIASICLPEIVEVLDPRVIVVHRSYDDIERTRSRRNWPEHFGRKGAAVIYPKIDADLARLRKPFLALSYADLVGDTEHALRATIEFCGLQELAPRLPVACGFVRNPV